MNATAALKDYFSRLIEKVESTDEISNAGKDENGFYKPKKTIVLRHLMMLRDLCDKPLAKPMLKQAWTAVTAELPPEWLILNEEEKRDLKAMLE
jgi:hypothetical protein